MRAHVSEGASGARWRWLTAPACVLGAAVSPAPFCFGYSASFDRPCCYNLPAVPPLYGTGGGEGKAGVPQTQGWWQGMRARPPQPSGRQARTEGMRLQCRRHDNPPPPFAGGFLTIVMTMCCHTIKLNGVSAPPSAAGGGTAAGCAAPTECGARSPQRPSAGLVSPRTRCGGGGGVGHSGAGGPVGVTKPGPVQSLSGPAPR